MSLNNAQKEKNDKELTLALQILKFQCDHSPNGDFNKKLREIDTQLSNLGSNYRTIDILNDLMVKLPSVIGTIKFLEILNEQEKAKTPIVEKNGNVKPEIIDEGEIIICDNQMETNQLNEIPGPSRNHRRSSQRKAANRANQELTSTFPSKNRQGENPTPTQKTFRDAKFEHYFYSSSEESENEDEREKQGNENQQQPQSSLLTQQDSTSKLEKVADEEIVEEVPETPEMTVDEIRELAAENAKRNKRVRYYSADDENENTGKKKRVGKASTKKSPAKKRKVKSKQATDQENEKEASKNEQENKKEASKNRQENLVAGSSHNFAMEQENQNQLNNFNLVQEVLEFYRLNQNLIENWAQNQPTTPPKNNRDAKTDNDIVQKCWNDTQLDKIVSKIGNIPLTVKDLHTLKPHSWLNDQVVDAYMELIEFRSQKNPALLKIYAFSTFFYGVLMKQGYNGVSRWTTKVNIFLYDILLFPIYNDEHWTLIAIDLKRDLYGYFDSMEFIDDEISIETGRNYIHRIYKYLKAESIERRKKKYQRSGNRGSTFNGPTQDNNNDGGVFVCCFAEVLARGNEFGRFDFTQDDILDKRRRIAYELLTGALIES